jgi:hypothetical protein
MSTRFVFVLTSALALASLAGCSGGSTTTTKSGTSGTPATSSTSPSTPAPSGSGSSSSSGGEAPEDENGASLGPSCTAYLACCDEVAAKVPQLGSSCDSTRKSITDAQGKNASVDAYESACKSGLDGFKSAGYCK